MSSAPDAEVILLLRENADGRVDGSVRTTKGVDATKVVGFWNGGGHKGAAGFDVDGPLEEAERSVVIQIKKWQAERLGVQGPTATTTSRRSQTADVPGGTKPVQPSRDPQQPRSPHPQSPQQPQQPRQSRPSQPPPRPVERSRSPRQAVNRPPANQQQAAPQQPLSDEELDAYFKKTPGAKGQVIDQGPPQGPGRNQG